MYHNQLKAHAAYYARTHLVGDRMKDIGTANNTESETLVLTNPKDKRDMNEDLGNGIWLEMLEIPGGTFEMGSPKNGQDEGFEEQPQREVTVQPFDLGKFPVTQSQWAQIAGLPKIAIELDPYSSFCQGMRNPVDSVSWQDAIEFCARLSHKTGKLYRLPSETEWEYACRAGTQTAYHFGAVINPKWANYSYPEARHNSTTPVGYFNVANNFGLYDMHGNVCEWCSDPWHESYRVFFLNHAPKDGRVWDQNSDRYYKIVENIHSLLQSTRTRVSRGGSWFNEAWFCRSATRFRMNATTRLGNHGFRVCRGR